MPDTFDLICAVPPECCLFGEIAQITIADLMRETCPENAQTFFLRLVPAFFPFSIDFGAAADDAQLIVHVDELSVARAAADQVEIRPEYARDEQFFKDMEPMADSTPAVFFNSDPETAELLWSTVKVNVGQHDTLFQHQDALGVSPFQET
ncbi:hypothetical protein LTS17_008568 [Exophiala oligosperma]